MIRRTDGQPLVPPRFAYGPWPVVIGLVLGVLVGRWLGHAI